MGERTAPFRVTASLDADDGADDETGRHVDEETEGEGERETVVESGNDFAERDGRDVRNSGERDARAPGGRDVRNSGERDARAPGGRDVRAPGEFDRNELIAAIRDVFEEHAELDRDAATREVARKLGFARTGNRVAEAIDLALIAAVKRGVIKNERGWLSLDCRDIGDYPRELLTEMLLAAMGRGWTERDEAVIAATRHLGFRRTGAAIKKAFKSIINGAIRRGLLEYDGSLIRKAQSSW
ncbi:MAG: hypothetical protein AB7P14_08970 [Blastocatellales bacterium]